MSTIQKYYYLQFALKGEATSVIQGLEVSKSSYTTALELFIKRYENTQASMNMHIKAITNIVPVYKEILSALRRLHDTSIQHIRAAL